jgi:large conductance mechanosensitive channel
MPRGFRDFLFRGNVVELAVAVAIGTAFTALVAQFGRSFINPLINLVGGGTKASGTFRVRSQVFDWGSFVNAVIVFVITATILYFVIVVPMQRVMDRLRRKEEREKASEPTDIELLTEIRDLLRAQSRQ